MKLLADKISYIRHKMNYTQEQLAEYLNVSRQTISKWESRTALPDTTRIPFLANKLEVSCDYLLDDNIPIGYQPKINTTTNSITVDWQTIYPILKQYKNEVNILKYQEIILNILNDIMTTYNYSFEDAMLVTKDILADTYFKNLK